MDKYFSRGKLLLTGEYVALDGAKSIALATRLGQEMKVKPTTKNLFNWRALLCDGNLWFDACFDSGKDFEIIHTTNESIALKLQKILKVANSLSKNKIKNNFEIITQLEFDKNWGWGSSSTLISNISKWLKIDALELLEKTIGGSGYDVAVAFYNQSLIYQKNSTSKIDLTFQFEPIFKEHLFFIYSENKQDTYSQISNYKKIDEKIRLEAKKKIDIISNQIMSVNDIDVFSDLLYHHESIIASMLSKETIKEKFFDDYPFLIKSLGAWGGDFFLAIGEKKDMNYFIKKGYNTILAWREAIATPTDRFL